MTGSAALLDEEGLCLGLSSGINVAGAVRLARQLGPGSRVATILCDTGFRYLSTLYNPRMAARRRGLAGDRDDVDRSLDASALHLATDEAGRAIPAQTMQRVKVGVIGLAAVMLLIGLASAIFGSASRERPVSAVGAPKAEVVANMAIDNGA